MSGRRGPPSGTPAAGSKKEAQIVSYRVGKWLPSDQERLNDWLKKLIEEVDGTDEIDGADEIDAAAEGLKIPGLLPPVEDLKTLIETDSEVSMFFHQMFAQVPFKPPYILDPMGKPQVRHYRLMLRLINRVMTKAPEYSRKGLVGFPINAILDWPMATVGGYAAFLNDKVNTQLKRVLNCWGTFLKSSDSCYVLSNDDKTGWFGKEAMEDMPNFDLEFVCDPKAAYHGFTSWDDFFVRQYREGMRPIASPDDTKVIANACESATFNIQFNVKRRARFWIKSQPYSMQFMLANDPLVDLFVGGTVYQAFLSALSYHRWHSPVDGIIKKAYVVEGSYYSEAQCAGFDDSAPNDTQSYLTEVAARAVIFIEADNKYIGLMAFLAIGMAEVSTNEITVYEGQRVKKGQELGMFHFGGSTHCLIFRPGVEVKFVVEQKEIGEYPHDNIPINSKIATVPYDQ
ncbi:uncharacterized protein LOC135352111 [Halichondria panicea]|uniref:uncharacterized protein LOC135352111 n=1 Tax=Halichondria panicea TaxID=6063 RepID=UPI00312BC2EE